jgi:hypothetical protein
VTVARFGSGKPSHRSPSIAEAQAFLLLRRYSGVPPAGGAAALAALVREASPRSYGRLKAGCGSMAAILLAHGFAPDLIASIASLVRAGLATAQIERVVAGAPSTFAKSLLICPNGRTPPHPQIDRVLHAGRCRRHDRLGDRWRTNRGPLAGASARITEMTRCRQVCLAGMWRLRPRRTATGCIEPSRALSPRMVNLIAELVQDWRRLDERIAAVSAEIVACGTG